MKYFRPLIAILLIIACVIGFILKLGIPADFIETLTTALAVYWFKSRDDTKNRDNQNPPDNPPEQPK